MKVWLKTDLAYIAGFIDGEGCLYLGYRRTRTRHCFPCTITLAQTEESVISSLQQMFGGKVYPVKIHGKGQKPVWQWSIYGEDGDRLLRLIMPYLRIKRKQAEVYIRMRRMINAKPFYRKITLDELEERKNLVLLIKRLKD